MNRKQFIKNIGLSAIGISILPLVSFTKQTNKRNIYNLKCPFFCLSLKDERGILYKNQRMCVQTYSGTLNELVNRNKDATILFYKENTYYTVDVIIPYTRAVIIPKEYNWKIVDITYPELYKK